MIIQASAHTGIFTSRHCSHDLLVLPIQSVQLSGPPVHLLGTPVQPALQGCQRLLPLLQLGFSLL